MSRKKGLSVDEKRKRMMDFFYEKKDFFQLREVEKLCQKEKGITSMSVKEILQSLVDDGMVDTDKIGTCVYFWALPSKASQNRQRKLDALQTELGEAESKRDAALRLITKAQIGREDTSERSAVLTSLETRQREREELMASLEKYRECDPEVMQQMKEETEMAREAANRWTDNVFSAKSWIKNKFSFESSVIDKQFGIPEEFDYLD